jgi:hypothetical protein
LGAKYYHKSKITCLINSQKKGNPLFLFFSKGEAGNPDALNRQHSGLFLQAHRAVTGFFSKTSAYRNTVKLMPPPLGVFEKSTNFNP